ncbi:hypothetical protein Droror1_Dr00007796 [Drosera rotundifolia]
MPDSTAKGSAWRTGKGFEGGSNPAWRSDAFPRGKAEPWCGSIGKAKGSYVPAWGLRATGALQNKLSRGADGVWDEDA